MYKIFLQERINTHDRQHAGNHGSCLCRQSSRLCSDSTACNGCSGRLVDFYQHSVSYRPQGFFIDVIRRIKHEFHWFTAENKDNVAMKWCRIGITIRIRVFNSEAPSSLADSNNAIGMEPKKFMPTIIKNRFSMDGITNTQKVFTK